MLRPIFLLGPLLNDGEGVKCIGRPRRVAPTVTGHCGSRATPGMSTMDSRFRG